VQEALTNARKHAPGEAATVRLSGAAGFGLEVEVRNGTGPAGIDLPPSGVGLVGLAERVALAGGTLEHGLRPDGSFVLRARLPWQK
jgi:signal transduction histidine kinase